MKKLLLLLFISLVGLVNMRAEICEIIYSIDYNDGTTRSRSVVMKPLHIIQSEEYIVLSSSSGQYAFVTISDVNGIEMKHETVTIMSGQDTLLYIGDLTSGTYGLTIETNSYTLQGSFDVE